VPSAVKRFQIFQSRLALTITWNRIYYQHDPLRRTGVSSPNHLLSHLTETLPGELNRKACAKCNKQPQNPS